MELAGIHSPTTALVAGLVTSLHCAGMCGPMACWLMPTSPEEDPTTIFTAYQSARLTGYAFLGLVAGAVGQVPLAWLSTSVLRFLPWASVLFFIAVALRWDKRLPRVPALTRLVFALPARLRGRSRVLTAAALGTVTPLLPCGPLYFLIALAALSGSALRGLEFMLAFGLGTLPLLWFAQANFGWLRTRLTPTSLARSRVCLAFASAAVIAWRLRGTLGFAGSGVGNWICF